MNFSATFSGEVRAVQGIASTLSVGQVIWAPSSVGTNQHLVFVGWSSDQRKLGIKYCYNRPCALYAIKNPFNQSEANEKDSKWAHLSSVSCSCLYDLFFCYSRCRTKHSKLLKVSRCLFLVLKFFSVTIMVLNFYKLRKYRITMVFALQSKWKYVAGSCSPKGSP